MQDLQDVVQDLQLLGAVLHPVPQPTAPLRLPPAPPRLPVISCAEGLSSPLGYYWVCDDVDDEVLSVGIASRGKGAGTTWLPSCISLSATGPSGGCCLQLKEYLTKTGCVAILDLFEQVALLRVRVSDAEASGSGA